MILPRFFFRVPPLALLALLAFTAHVRGQSANDPRQQLVNQEPAIKAKLVDLQRHLWTWPQAAAPAPGTPFKIGILGNDPFQQGQINHLDRRLAGEDNVAVLRFSSVDDYQPCQILFVSEAENLQPALGKVRGGNVLVMAQAPGLAKQGAVMNLPIVQNRVKIEINLSAAQRAGLKPNPGLLRSAEIIR